MEIRVHGPGRTPTPLAVTMRTPGNDFELAVGLLPHRRASSRDADDIDTDRLLPRTARVSRSTTS